MSNIIIWCLIWNPVCVHELCIHVFILILPRSKQNIFTVERQKSWHFFILTSKHSQLDVIIEVMYLCGTHTHHHRVWSEQTNSNESCALAFNDHLTATASSKAVHNYTRAVHFKGRCGGNVGGSIKNGLRTSTSTRMTTLKITKGKSKSSKTKEFSIKVYLDVVIFLLKVVYLQRLKKLIKCVGNIVCIIYFHKSQIQLYCTVQIHKTRFV